MDLKDKYFNETTVLNFLNQILNYHDFDHNSFFDNATSSFPTLELKERVTHVRKLLKDYMPSNYYDTIEIFSKVLKTNEGDDFLYASFLEYIEYYGCNNNFIDFSLNKIGEFTSSFTAEFAIRRFINEYEDKTLEKLFNWSKSSDYHQRRLSSEGSRPNLPWAVKVKLHYSKTIPILDNLYNDESRYVTRSVANHLNDISKVDPALVLKTLNRWKNEGKQTQKEMKYIINHSLRTLIKKGHLETLKFLGYSDSPLINVKLILSKNIYSIGDYLEFEIEINPKEDANIVIDYIIHYPTKAGNISKKVYKIKTAKVMKNKTNIIKRKNLLVNRSTRKLCPGLHKMFIQLNGKIVASNEFYLEK